MMCLRRGGVWDQNRENKSLCLWGTTTKTRGASKKALGARGRGGIAKGGGMN